MIKKILTLFFIFSLLSISAFASDNFLFGGKGAANYLFDNASHYWAANICMTTDGNGNAIPISSGGGGGGGSVTVSAAIPGRSSVALARNVYSSTNVTTSAYVQLISSLPAAVNEVNIFDSSGQLLVLAVGAPGFEVDKLYITPGGTGTVDLAIPSGSRIAIKAVSANATTGFLAISFLQ